MIPPCACPTHGGFSLKEGEELTQIIQQITLTLLNESVDHLTKQGIGPSEPFTGEILRIILVEGFMHKSCIRIRVAQHLDSFADLFFVTGRITTHDDAHRPNEIVSDMGTTDSFARLTLEEIGIAIAQEQFAGILIDRVLQ